VAVGDETGDREGSEARIAFLEAALAERDAKVAELTEQVAKLTEALSRNSRNSHLPPSSDGPGSSSGPGTTGHRSGKSGRKRGGQKGHRGSHRELLSPERVDTFVDLFPEVCLGCASPLARVVDVAACRYQQLDLRDHRPHVTEWRRHEVDCQRCGSSTTAGYDGAQIPASHSALA
jgi:transposase